MTNAAVLCGSRGDKMKVKVICSACDGLFDWKWGKSKGECEHCESNLTIKQVKLAQGELVKLFQ
jgi:rRNA maturation endonuclease Nob1